MWPDGRAARGGAGAGDLAVAQGDGGQVPTEEGTQPLTGASGLMSSSTNALIVHYPRWGNRTMRALKPGHKQAAAGHL